MPVIEIKVPNIAESITEVTLSQWLKENGAMVKIDEPICEFESDKATLELPAEAAGKLIWVAEAGADLKIGALVAKIDTEAAAAGGKEQPAAPAPAASATTPKDAAVAAGASATPKDAQPEAVPAPAAEAKPAPAASGRDAYAVGSPSPAAAKTMAENGLSAAQIDGSGRDGRITKEDAHKATDAKTAAPAVAVPPPAPATAKTETAPPAAPAKTESAKPAPTAPTVSFSRNEHKNKMSRMRRTIAKRLVSAKNNTAMLTTFNEVDMTELMALREKYQDRFVKKYGIKLGFMSLFAKACAKVLMEMPDVNAMIDGEDMVYHDYADISIAISTPNGLVVPPVMNVESLKFHEVEIKIKELAEKARNGKLSLEDMSGGTFTITNGGIFGSMMSTPIINEPQSAILGMHAILQRPMAINGEVKIRPMMYLALSYDHRVIDGSTSVTFLVKVKQLLEDPTALLMDL